MPYIVQIDRLPLGSSRTGLQGKQRWVFDAASNEHAMELAKHFVEAECPQGRVEELYGISPQPDMVRMVRELHEIAPSLLEKPLGTEDWRMVDGTRFTSVPMGSLGSLLSYMTYRTVPTAMAWLRT